MSQKNDQVFNLSITEIWMVLAFILLLLTGWQVWKLTKEKNSLEQKVAGLNDLSDREKAIDEATDAFKVKLKNLGIKNPDEVIAKLMEQLCVICRHHTPRFRARCVAWQSMASENMPQLS